MLKWQMELEVLPAYAGMIPRLPRLPLPLTCAPRVCGDDPCVPCRQKCNRIVLPAYAGMIRKDTASLAVRYGAPRVCGDDPKYGKLLVVGEVCSPRMRG